MIEVDDLYVSYGEQEVLKGLSLSVKTGETLVILGRSGVGKTEFARRLAKLANARFVKVEAT